MTTILREETPTIVVGVDAHKHEHHVAVLDQRGVFLADQRFAASSEGYEELSNWIASMGTLSSIGVESTGSYARGLTRFLHERDIEVVEVNRPHKHLRARVGKDDAIDAEAAARKVLSGEATAKAKNSGGTVESIRQLQMVRVSAVKSRAVTLLQLQALLVTAPSSLRESVNAKTGHAKAVQCLALRPDLTRVHEPLQAAKLALRSLARRIRNLDEEVRGLDQLLSTLVKAQAPTLVSKVGVGTHNAAQLLITAGQNIDRLSSEAAFARLCGVAPIPASSGQTQRMRLHRGGDRQANRALHMIVVCRLHYDQRTKDYMERRRAEGLSKKDVLRCLKRFVAREVFYDLRTDLLQN